MVGFPSEHMEQVKLFAWIKSKVQKYPKMEFIFAVPNGGMRSKAIGAKLKAEGVKSGVSDICVPIPIAPYHGAWIEMKSCNPKAKASTEQKTFAKAMLKNGYQVYLCRGAENAIQSLSDYLQM